MRKSSLSVVRVAVLMAIIAIPVQLLCAQESLRTSRVLAPVNEQQVVMLGGHVAPWATSANDVGTAPDSVKLDLHLVLKRSDAQKAALQKLLDEQQNRNSADYHKWLTPEEYGARFGISDADLAKVTSWLTSHGFVVENAAKGNNIIRFSGTHAQLQKALHTTLHQYKVNGELHYANASNPMIPAALAPVITAIHGLNDMKPKPMHTTPKLATRKKGDKNWQVLGTTPVGGASSSGVNPEFEWQFNNRSWHLLSPGDFAAIYGLQSVYGNYDGTGQTIAIVAATDINPKDVDDFRAAFGLPPTKLNIIHNGPDPGFDSGSEGEADLDVEWSGAVARNATIDLVVSQDLLDSVIYIVNNNVAPIMSISYGLCELYFGTDGNAFMSEVYQQAASQGITVISAAGDEGSASCSHGGEYSYGGLSVNGLASTPYNVAVGGTDFPVNVLGDPSTYWSSTNDASDQHSALSYVPEAPWNNSCGSPEIVAALQAKAQRDPANYGQWAPDTTPELLCNDPLAQPYYLAVVGGGGGASNCITTDDYNARECNTGHPQPSWQTGVPGVAADSRRHIPDVSFFAGSGVWHSAYIFCQSDATPNGTCFGDNLQYLSAGGTSFAAPSFAGVVALLNQKANSWQGNINYTLYDLGNKQFNDATKKDACQVGDTTTISDSSCVFHDLTQGGNQVACGKGSIDNPPSGVCTPSDSSHKYGILSGYDAGAGYDSASGLGSINVANLLNTWPTNLATTQTSLTLTAVSNQDYGVPLTGSGTVTVTSASGTPTGSVALMYKDPSGNSHSGDAPTDLVNGTGNLSLNLIVPVGDIKLYARYGGDNNYTSSISPEQTITISPATTTLQLTPSITTVGPRQSTQLTATITTGSIGDYPTGTVTFKNATTGTVIATVPVTGAKYYSTGYVYATATATTGGGGLVHGDNQITATFSGDTSYLGATGSAPTIQYTGGFSIAASSSSLTLSPGATSGNTVVLTAKPLSSGVTLSASSINFSCPGTMPAGVTCEFSAPVANSDGSVYSTLTVFLSAPLQQSSLVPAHHLRNNLAAFLAIMAFGSVLVVTPRKRRAAFAVCMVLVVLFVMFSFGCGGSSHKTTPPHATTTVTLTASSMTPALNSPVTLKATLSNSAATGTVSFFDGTKSLGSAAVSSGATSITTSSLPVGTRTITASYSGDTTYPAATSAAVAVDVTFTASVTAQAVDAVTGDNAQQLVTLTVK